MEKPKYVFCVHCGNATEHPCTTAQAPACHNTMTAAELIRKRMMKRMTKQAIEAVRKVTIGEPSPEKR